MAVDAHRRFARPTWYHVVGALRCVNDCLSAFAIVLLDILSLPMGGNSVVVVGLVAIDAPSHSRNTFLRPLRSIRGGRGARQFCKRFTPKNICHVDPFAPPLRLLLEFYSSSRWRCVSAIFASGW